MLDYKLLEALAAVVAEGGFDRAARALHLTQSAVSQRVRLLEERMGQVLLDRTQPPALTAAGKLLVRHVREVERLEHELLGGIVPDYESESFAEVPVAVNADSLATWFPAAVAALLGRRRIALDVRLLDQELTQTLLRNGEVMGCVSAQSKPAQGCRVDRLGRMDYRLLSTAAFAGTWFPDGVDLASARRAPMVVFNRVDRLHERLFRRMFRRARVDPPVHYMPSSPSCLEMITAGLAYGVVPDPQGAPLLASGALVDLAPGEAVPVDLHWHCWNLRSDLLDDLTAAVVAAARTALPQTSGAARR